jgi:hypothetical protein
MNLVDLRCNAKRQLPAPIPPIVPDDLEEIYEFPSLHQHVSAKIDLNPEHLIIKKGIIENPAFEAFKYEVIA